MSRTRVHRALLTRITDPTLVLEVHRHDHGPCSLPTPEEQLARAKSSGDWWPKDRCSWAPLDHLWDGRCGCWMCTASVSRRIARRSARHESARILAATRGWRTVTDDLEDLPLLPHPKAW